MKARPRRVVGSAFAAAIVLALLAAPAQAQGQAPERQFTPSPLKLFKRAFGELRGPEARPSAAAAKAGSAPRSARRGSDTRKPPAAASSRVPKPRPADGAGTASEIAASTAGGPVEPADGVAADPPTPAVAAAEPFSARIDPPAEPADPRDMALDPEALPADFAGAGVDPARDTLPVPDGVAPRAEGVEEFQADAAPPTQPDPEPAAAAPPDATASIEDLARLPRSRPDGPAAVLAMVDPGGVPEPVAPAEVVVSRPEDPGCLDRLRELDVVFSQEPPVGEGACHLAHPLKVSAIGSGVRIAPAATLNCRTAEALALWTRGSLVPTARRILDEVPTAIAPGSTYECRTRNRQNGGRMSEHAVANAFDVMSIAFAGREPIAIGSGAPGSPAGRFEAEIRKQSCGYFTTVLGPGSDASHANHLHFDLAERRGGYRLCDLGATNTADLTP